jgi:hypothetical protein
MFPEADLPRPQKCVEEIKKAPVLSLLPLWCTFIMPARQCQGTDRRRTMFVAVDTGASYYYISASCFIDVSFADFCPSIMQQY